MKNKYQQLQDMICVTSDMEQRILTRLVQTEQSISELKKPVLFRIPLKYAISIFACLALVVCFMTVRPYLITPDTPTPPILTVSPVIDYENLSDLSKNLSFPLYVPSNIPKDYSLEFSSIMFEKTAQLIYSDNSDIIKFQMTKGDLDERGDFTEYKQIKIVPSDHGKLTIKGNNDLFSVVSWSQNGFSFSISTSKPLSLKTMVGLAEGVVPYSSQYAR
ncbi:DUF4367 domain-containing protein [Paenibacillus guangzhouensis]|uniref:DUF4367 domain-containing protein n=1 Tax=Paenibacillus guangzhouensis TaxID=1473112 RepID=UPI00187B455B|nr:DUF4367 domain-containing protein [Paenibacillus guangzhouensis]